MEDGWTPWWHRWFGERTGVDEAAEVRTLWIRDRVRAAVRELAEPERAVIEGWYYDGLSLDRIGAQLHLSKNRVVVAHRRALAELRVALAPLAAEAFGISAVRESLCPICMADWRVEAEAMLDGKTVEMTWGELIVRLERAFGWRASGPRVLIVHQKRHRMFNRPGDVQRTEEGNDDWTITGATLNQALRLDGNEDASGRVGGQA